jgi:DNA-directed RNA polymerase specialized sigma24 family protein
LPDRYRLPLVLCYLEGKSNHEAAAQLRCPVGTIKGRLSRARQTLRERLRRRGLGAQQACL